jgi:hypothetical protein
MNVMKVFVVVCCQLLLVACGGAGSTASDSSQLIAGKNAASSGHFINPLAAETVNGNILTTLVASDPEGIEQVLLRFNGNSGGLILCQGQQQCGSQYAATHSGINPRDYGVGAGSLQLALWVTDSQGQSAEVATVSVLWQPPQLNGIVVQRSADGTSATVSWDLNTSLLRYNLYLAEVSGVNKSNFVQLAGGQALLAVSGAPQTFQNLSPTVVYYLLVTGIDGSGESAYSTEQIIAAIGAPINGAPVANDDSFSTSIDTPINLDVLSNDTDPEGDNLSLVSTSAANGTITINPDFSLDYTPAAGFVGSDTFTYIIDDANGNTSQGSVTVVVSSTNVPIATTDYYDVQADTLLSIQVNQGVLLNDDDPMQETLTVELTPISPPLHGVLSLGADGHFSYQPDTGFAGNDSFIYRIFNDTGNSAVATVNLNVRTLSGSLIGDSTSITGELLYLGLGELTPNSGIGTGRYRIGNCIQSIDTVCTMLGDYVESASSEINPGSGGRYAFTMKYSGIGPSPVIARSNTAGNNSVFFTDTADAIFELSLFPNAGGEFIAQYPATDFAQSIGFGAFITNNETCQGLPQGFTCSIGQAGLVVGSQLTASLNNLQFSVPDIAIGTGANSIPVAVDDQYQTLVNTPLSISAPGILINDTDEDTGLVGDILTIHSQFNPGMGELDGLAFDEYKQLLYLYPSLMGGVYIYDRIAQLQNSYLVTGEVANDVDVEIAPQSFMLAGVLVPQGSVIVINGETAAAEIYALEPTSGALIAQLNTSFGASHVVGGTYNVVTSSFFLVQDRVAGGAAGNVIAEIDPASGLVLNSFTVNNVSHPFEVNYGDIEADTYTGNLYVVSSLQTGIAEFTSDGGFVREIPLPQAVSGISGIGLNHNGDRFWLSSTNGQVYEMSFSNGGQMPKLVASIKKAPQNGSLQLSADGSFTYTPDSGFIGQDSFIYLTSDQLGGVSSATVTLNVN